MASTMLRKQLAARSLSRVAPAPRAVVPFVPVKLHNRNASLFKLNAAAVDAELTDEQLEELYSTPQQAQVKREKKRTKRFKAMQAKVFLIV